MSYTMYAAANESHDKLTRLEQNQQHDAVCASLIGPREKSRGPAGEATAHGYPH